MSFLLALLACGPSGPTPIPPPPPPGEVAHLERAGTTAPAPVGRPNVVLVLGCTVRRDQVSAYGGPAGTTPFLESLAATGTRMADPIVAAPWTRASSAALVTGRHPIELGLVDPEEGRNDRALPDEAETLAERFRAHGYRTVGATANPNLNTVFGFDQGFDAYVQPAQLWREALVKLPGADLIPEVLQHVGSAEERPLFLQVMLIDAHAPHVVPDPDAFREPGVPEEAVLYRASLRELDRAVADLRGKLEASGFTRDNTVFVVVSDHGEGLSWPAHHGISHGHYLYSSAVNAIWMLEGPGIPAGRVVDGVTSHVDVGRTLLSLAGFPEEMPGLDHAPRIREDAPNPRTSAIVDTWFHGADRAAIVTDDRVCMRAFEHDRKTPPPTGRFVPGCYDRLTDPMNRAPLPESDVALLAELEAWRAARPVGKGRDVEVSAELAEQLEKLGYTE